MPFPLRTISPLKLCRLEEDVAAVQRDKEGHARRSGTRLLFGSLEEVCSRSLVSLLWQLSDLSRCASDVFGGIQSEADCLGRRSARLQRRLDSLKALASCLDHRKVKIPVSNLEEESRWTVHYTAPWHQQENVFLPSTRPPCVEDLHRQAKLNLKSILRECDKIRRDGCRSSQYYSQGPTFSSSSSTICGSYHEDYEDVERKCSTPSPEEEKLIALQRPKTPIPDEFSDINTQTNWTKLLPLPTPEEKMRQQAQAVQTDVIPINVTVGSGKCDMRGHSLCVPDHYSTLGRLDSYHSSLQQGDTKDSGCQTEEVKVVPPSVRRIRAQKGQGIAAQMSQLSSSSGNMSVMSDSAGIAFASRPNNDLGFHSLPRSGARASVNLLERRHSVSKSTESGLLSHQRSALQGSESIDDMRNSCRTSLLQKPKLQEVKNFENEKAESPACIVSPHLTYSTHIIPNATLTSSSEVIVIHTAQNSESISTKITNSSLYPKPKDNLIANSTVNTKERHSSCGTWSETSSTHHSQSSDSTLSSNGLMVLASGDAGVSLPDTGTMESISQCRAYNCRNNLSFPSHSQGLYSRSESSYTVDKMLDKEKNGKYRGFKYSENKDTSLYISNCTILGCSTPGNLERVSDKADSNSLYSVDHDGYYTSMHMDSDLQPDKNCNDNGLRNIRHSVINVFTGSEKKSLGDFINSSDKSLSRSISFKKAKKPPLPPSRTDSLRRTPKNKVPSSGQVLDDTLIASLQHSLQLNLQCKDGSSPSQSPSSDYDDPWVLRSRSQSSVSASSSMMSATGLNMYSLCTVTPSQSETSSIKSEYADQWYYYSDYPGIPEDHLKSTVNHSFPTAPKLMDDVNYLNDRSRASLPQVPTKVVKPKAVSPEKSHRVTSPSSGYSSQSNTPTALTPVPVILKSMSTGHSKSKMKPKVPERKSSLLSSVSVSSSSTSLSSSTSAEGSVNLKKPDSALNFPQVPPSPDSDSHLPPPPLPLTEVMDLPPPPGSPSFPPPPPEAATSSSSPQNITWLNCQEPSRHFSHSLIPASSHPLPTPFLSSGAPPAPPLDPKFLKDSYKAVPYPPRKSNLEASSHTPVKQPFHRDDPNRPAMPLITTEALQMVQLRSVKKAMMLEQAAESACKFNPQGKKWEIPTQLSLKSHLSVGCSLDEGEVKPHSASVYSPSQRPDLDPSSRGSEPNNAKMPSNAACLANSFARDLQPSKAAEALGQKQDFHCDLARSSLQEQSRFLSKSQDILPNKKPPPVSKKPKLFLTVPPPQPDVTAEKITVVGENAKSIPSAATKDAEIVQYSQINDYPTDGLCSYAMDSGNLIPEGGAADSISFETSLSVLQQEAKSCLSERSSSDRDRNGDSISGAEKHVLQGDESSEVIEADAANSVFQQSPSCRKGGETVAVPIRPRTTEDLFAAIHRSKRKVLGRKDSEDDRTRNHSPSPPVTPTGSSPNLAFLKQAGSIQRNIRKSSTSNDNFKALLLKKGSRSDTNSRMSAAEMLKNTDPRFQRAKVDSPLDISESTFGSPTKTRRAQEEWARSEGLMPRSLYFSNTRYSRSRTPPSAASSKYNVRNRIQSSPMTVISEGDVEAVEPTENRTPRSLEEEQPDVFESDEMDASEHRDSTEDTTYKELVS